MINRAFTYLEVVVCLGIVSLCLALVAHGLGAARESSRRLGCQNNLRQTGIALHQFIEISAGKLPHHMPHGAFTGSTGPALVGPWYQLASMLELNSLKAELVFNGWGVPSHNEQQLPPLFRCPSDSMVGCNYRTCGGSGLLIHPGAIRPQGPVWHDTADGMVIVSHQPKVVSEVTDGLSNTAFASERLVYQAGGSLTSQIAFDPWIRPEDFIEDGRPYDRFLEFVNSNWNAWDKLPHSGRAWHGVGLVQTAYNHLAVPNYDTAMVIFTTSEASHGFVGASSHHPGGVNVAKADGSVIFVSDSIDANVWKGLATIASGDERLASSD